VQLLVLWQTAYATAKQTGAVDSDAFKSINRMWQAGELSPADVAAWVNRRHEQSGCVPPAPLLQRVFVDSSTHSPAAFCNILRRYTILHQVAWHGNYNKHKQVCAAALERVFATPLLL